MKTLAIIFVVVVASLSLSSVVEGQDDVSSTTIPTPTKCPPKPESIKDLDVNRVRSVQQAVDHVEVVVLLVTSWIEPLW